MEQFKEDAKKIHINAEIYVERDSQKGIILGKQGNCLLYTSRCVYETGDNPVY